MSVFTLADNAEQVTIGIRVKDRDQMITFYKDMIGFALKTEENALAIMGLKENKAEYLWLEESPRAEEHFGEVKKLKQFTLAVSSVEELSDVYHRLKESSYPIVQTSYDEKARLLVDDPEKNRLEIVANIGKKEVKNDEQLLSLATGKFANLSKDASFQQVHLNVTEAKTEENFLQNALGFYLGKEEAENSDLNVILHVIHDQPFDIASTEVLGLEIIRLVITREELVALEKRLAENKQDFYIDKKKSILTVYDPAGVEWWFVRKSDK